MTQAATIEYFLEHEGVLYPDPLAVQADGSTRIYPEAPGHYVVRAHCTSDEGENHWYETTFHVKGVEGDAPQRIRVADSRLWTPTPWDGHLLSAHERTVFDQLRSIIRPGDVVYDVGANVGPFAAQFLSWVGRTGWLYAFEPNPVCLYFLRANLADSRQRNYTILPFAISDETGLAAFTLNYGSSLIGSSEGLFAGRKPGHHIQVDKRSLDSLVASFHLKAPRFIKIDVEGAEAAVVSGMRHTLERERPALMIELHGRASASHTLGQLAGVGYRFTRPPDTRQVSAQILLDDLRDECFQVIGHP
jgi:FkbM family methyltransferase